MTDTRRGPFAVGWNSVDGVDRGLGGVTLVQALAEQRSGRAGQYGAGPGATAVLPAPEPAVAAPARRVGSGRLKPRSGC